MSEPRSVADLRAEVLADLPDAVAEESFRDLQRAINELELERLRRLADLESRGIHEREGHLSLASWVAATFGTSLRSARAAVRFARSLNAMPVTVQAVHEGDVSLTSARLLADARAIDPAAFASSERMLVDAARNHPLRELGRVVAFWREHVEAGRIPDATERRFARRRLHVSPTIEGMVRIDGDVDPECGESLLTALASILDAEARSNADDARSPAQRRADALGEICRSHLDRSDRPEVAGERPHLTLTIDGGSLGGDAVLGELDHTGPVGGTLLRQLSCDASVTRVVMSGSSEPMDIGRRTPVVPASMRRAVVVRDRHCRFPGCDRPHHWCDAHHVVHWADGGTTSVENLLLLCRRHHRMVHQRFSLTAERGKALFRRADGSVLSVGRAPPSAA